MDTLTALMLVVFLLAFGANAYRAITGNRLGLVSWGTPEPPKRMRQQSAVVAALMAIVMVLILLNL